LGNEFPIFETPPQSLEDAQREAGDLAADFNFPTIGAAAVRADNLGETLVISDTSGRTLEVDIDTGSYYYLDPNRTFSPTVVSGVQGAQILTAGDAKQVADQFLTSKGLMPGDAVFNTVSEVILGQIQSGELGASSVLTEELTTYEVIYSRYLSATVPGINAATGLTETIVVSIPVDGPNAKTKVYVSPAGGSIAAATNEQAGAVVGAQGGWREVAQVSAGAVRETVTILPYDPQILALFQQLEPKVAYAFVPHPNPVNKTVLDHNLSAYEESNTDGQDVLYPAYRLLARYEGPVVSGGVTETVVFTDYSWIPANAQFMPPLAKIASTSDLSKPLAPGATINATAVDATTKLKDAGYDQSLDFTMGVGPYAYKWYLNEAKPENQIGSGRILTYTIPLLTEGAKEGLITNKLILEVTDTVSTHTSRNKSTDSVPFITPAPLFLPLISK
jgi:hypothetical protein